MLSAQVAKRRCYSQTDPSFSFDSVGLLISKCPQNKIFSNSGQTQTQTQFKLNMWFHMTFKIMVWPACILISTYCQFQGEPCHLKSTLIATLFTEEFLVTLKCDMKVARSLFLWIKCAQLSLVFIIIFGCWEMRMSSNIVMCTEKHVQHLLLIGKSS